jgi:predicted nicotinamide N-methyase
LNHRHADITATDIHPEAGKFLNLNVSLNGGQPIPFKRMNWKDTDNNLGVFDLIVGSDLLYEQNHAELLSKFIERHSSTNNEVIIIDPGRRHHASFSKKMVAMGFSHQQTSAENLNYLDKPYRGQILRYAR